MHVKELAKVSLRNEQWGSAMWIQLFGGKHKLPMGESTVTIIVNNEQIPIYLVPQMPNKRNHRVFVQCECGKYVPAGRVKQHKCRV